MVNFLASTNTGKVRDAPCWEAENGFKDPKAEQNLSFLIKPRDLKVNITPHRSRTLTVSAFTLLMGLNWSPRATNPPTGGGSGRCARAANDVRRNRL